MITFNEFTMPTRRLNEGRNLSDKNIHKRYDDYILKLERKKDDVVIFTYEDSKLKIGIITDKNEFPKDTYSFKELFHSRHYANIVEDGKQIFSL